MKTDFRIIPAVDIKEGKCVRLYRGLPTEKTVFAENPIAAGERWESEGAEMLHVVDLDGAFAGSPVNMDTVLKLAEAVSIPVQVGGGIRDTETAKAYLDGGCERVIVGTGAFADRRWLEEIACELKERLAVGLDTRKSIVVTEGWTGSRDLSPAEAVDYLCSSGVRRVIYTDVMRDGTMQGPDFEGIEYLAGVSRIPLIASGGVSDVKDVVRLWRMRGKGVEGVVIGMALYRGKFTLEGLRTAIEREVSKDARQEDNTLP